MLKIKKNNKQLVAVIPFGAHFTTRLSSVNNKLVCALSRGDSCADDKGAVED